MSLFGGLFKKALPGIGGVLAGIGGGLLGQHAAKGSLDSLIRYQNQNNPFNVYRTQANALIDALMGLAGTPINVPYVPEMPGGGILPIATGHILPPVSLRSAFTQQFPEYASMLPTPMPSQPINHNGKTGIPGVPNGTGPLARMLAMGGY